MAEGNSVVIRIEGDDSGLKKTLGNIGKTASAALKGMRVAADGVKALGTAISGVGVKYNARMEQLQKSFEVMTSSAQKAQEIMERIRTISAQTPFEAPGLAQATALLMNYGLTAEDALSRMMMLGDISQGNQEKMTRIATAYGQMSSAGKVQLEDIKQMIEAGFNPLQEIAESTGESMQSLYDRISRGTISVDEITRSMERATSEGGKYFQSMEKQSQTLNGQLSTLKDNAMELVGSMTQGLSDELRDELIPMAGNIVSELQSAFEAGGMDALISSATDMIPDLLGFATGEIQDAISGLTRWLPQGARAVMQAAPGALKGAVTVAPQITAALFDVASLVISDLVGMLPELVPTLVEGFGKMALSALEGMGNIITGLFDGVEQAFHQGQTKFAGIWIDDEQLAKFDFRVEVNVEDATKEISSAYAQVRQALSTDLLTEEQRLEILGMIGEDEEAIKAALMGFGLSEAEAGEIAQPIADAGAAIVSAIDALDLSVDAGTVLKWFFQANGSHLALRAALLTAGLSESDVSEILGIFEDMTGKVVSGTPDLMQEIYDKLTDGEPDDEQSVDSLKGKISNYIQGLLDGLQSEYQARLAALDPTAADYEEKKKALDSWYQTAKSDIQNLNTEMTHLVTTLAGAPTAVVEAKLEEFAELERRAAELEGRISGIGEKARSAGENAFEVTRAGATRVETTISTAIKFKFEEFKLDTQSAEDAYDAALEELTRAFNSGEISREQRLAGEADALAAREEAVQAAKAAYEAAFGEILAGIAEAEGNQAAMQEALDLKSLYDSVNAAFTHLIETGVIDPEALNALGAQMQQALGDAIFDADLFAAYIESGDMSYIKSALTNAIDRIGEGITAAAQEALGGSVGAAYSAALEQGLLTGTSFDTTVAQEQLGAMLDAMVENGFEGAEGKVAAEAGKLPEAADVKNEMRSAGSDAGQGFLNGISPKLQQAVDTARTKAAQVAAAMRGALRIRSPSRVMMELGQFTGEGYDEGLRKSMDAAVRTARRISGEIVTAADLSGSMRVNMPSLQQEITLAAEQARSPVYLDGQQIAEIQGYNNSAKLAWRNTRAARGVGSR